MPEISLSEPTLAEALRDYAQIRRLSMQSLFESLETLCEGTVVVDHEARIVWINERYAKRLGASSAAEAIGKPVEEVIPSSLMRQVVRTGQPILLDIMETPGATFVVTRIPIKDEAGRVIGAAGFALFDQVQSLKPLFARFEAMQREIAQAQKRLAEERRSKYTFSNFIGASPVCMEVKRQARRAAQLNATVLLLGETGTGKELLAHAIHAASVRGDKPFVGVNVAAIPDNLLETEFFGAAPGAYTGADRRGRDGKFLLADGGTLFLDEIGDMPLLLQAKLLRVLQEQEFEPGGQGRCSHHRGNECRPPGARRRREVPCRPVLPAQRAFADRAAAARAFDRPRSPVREHLRADRATYRATPPRAAARCIGAAAPLCLARQCARTAERAGKSGHALGYLAAFCC